MSSLATSSELMKSQSSEHTGAKRHLANSRQVYDKLKQDSYEETKELATETNDPGETPFSICIRWLKERNMTYTEVDGEGETSLINALLQHATGEYNSRFFDQATVLSILVERPSASSQHIIQREDIQEMLEAVNKAMNISLFAVIIDINSRSRPEIVDEIGSSMGDPAVICQIEEGKYSSIVPSELLECSNVDCLDSIPQSYRNEIQSFKHHLYDIANPLIAKEILENLARIDSFCNSEGLLPIFSDIPKAKETSEALETLNNEILNILMKDSNQTDQVKARIIRDLKKLSGEIDLGEALWEELRVLFEIQAIKELPNTDIKKIKHYIDEEDTKKLRKNLESMLKARKIDINGINSQLSEIGLYDLRSLLAEIINKKPKMKEDLQYFWDKKEDFFINKTFFLNHPNQRNTINGLIEECNRPNQNCISFKLHNNTLVDIKKIENEYSIYITTETCVPFWTAFKEGKLKSKFFEIRTPQNFEEYTSEMVYPGSYIIKRVYKAHVNNKLKEDVYLEQTNTEKSKPTQYRISAIYNTECNDFPSFEISECQGANRVRNSHQLLFNEFRKTYNLVLKDRQSFTFDPSYHVTIRDVNDENQLKIKYLKVINTGIDLLRVELSKEDNRYLLNTLLDSLINSGITKVDIEILNKFHREDLFRKLNQITKVYRNHLNNEKLPEDILKEIVIDANHARIIKKSKVLEVSKAMELIRDAFDYIDEVIGKDIVLFIGNTGSGKSTTITYLLGAELEFFYNRAGDQVVKVKNESQLEDYPKIGQSLVESETLYARGYSVKTQDKKHCPVLLTDCPGLNDTRGGRYELCTNLSIDQFIEKCQNIEAIVITVPIQAFQLDRSSPIISHIETIVERFEDSFNVNKPDGNRRVFMLITKCNQVDQEIVKKLRDGSRFTELYNQAQERYSNLLDTQSENKSELNDAERNMNIWRVLLLMHDYKRIDILDIENKIQRIELLNKYSKSEGIISKNSYSGLMQSKDMQIKFSKCIEMSTHTWTHLILKEYLEVLPTSLILLQEIIENNDNRILELKQAKEAQYKRIEDLKEEQAKIQMQINNLDSCNTDLSQNISLEIIKKIESEIERIEKETSETSAKLNNISDEISKLDEKILQINSNIEKFQFVIIMLSRGTRIEKLYEEDYRGRENEIIEVYRYEHQTAEDYFEEFKELEDTGEVSTQVKANSIRGPIVKVKVFEKKYRLVPADPNLRREFEENFRSISGSSKYEAKIEGEGYKLIKCKADSNGRKVAYLFELQFGYSIINWITMKDPTMPWIRITHEIPNIEYNEATIINKNASINLMLREADQIKFELGGADGKSGKLAQKQKLEYKLNELNTRSQIYKDQLKRMESTYFLKILNRTLEEITDEIQQLECNTEIDEEIENIEQKIASDKEKKNNLIKTKKYLAIIIKTQLDSARLIREFTKIIMVDGKIEKVRSTDETFETCKEFNQVFDSYIDRIESEVDKDLAL